MQGLMQNKISCTSEQSYLETDTYFSDAEFLKTLSDSFLKQISFRSSSTSHTSHSVIIVTAPI